MKIAAVRATPFRLPLRSPLHTAHSLIAEREGWLLELETRSGLRGWGEASPLPTFGTEDAGRCEAALPVLARSVVGRDAVDIDVEHEGFVALAPAAPVARAAFDCALFDLRARAEGRGLAEWLSARWEGRAREAGEVNGLLGALDP